MLLGGIRYAAGRTKADCRVETGYTELYNGSTTGWSQAGPGSFTNSDATLTSTGGMGLFWFSTTEFHAYSLKLDWRMAGDDNSGVFVGFPASSDPSSAVANGYEIQIDATDAADRTTGAVYSFQSADIAARDAALNPPGEWNTFEILVEGERLQVFLNGVKINDFTNTDPVRSLTDGFVGIQNHGDGDDVSFRNIRIKQLGGRHTWQRSDHRHRRQVRRRRRQRHRRWHQGTAVDLQQHRRADLDAQRQHRASSRQVPGRLWWRHRGRHPRTAVDVQRHRRAGLDPTGRRLAGQPTVQQVPHATGQRHRGWHAARHLHVRWQRQPGLDPAVVLHSRYVGWTAPP